MMNNDFSMISSFLSAYFYPYWQEEYEWTGREPSFEDVTRHYKTENAPHIVEQATKELRQLLALSVTDFELHKESKNFFNYYESDGLTRRQVLENILKVLENPNNARGLKRIV